MSLTANDTGEPPEPPDPRAPITLKAQQNSPLLRLPAELRNAIYAYTCTHANLQCSRSLESGEYTTRITPGNANLRLACKQLYHEVHSDLQSCTHLTYNGFPGYLDCNIWPTIGSIKMDRIESIVVVREPRPFTLLDFHLFRDKRLLRKWPALRYFEMQGDFLWNGARCLNVLQETLMALPGVELEVCVKFDSNDVEERFNCRDQTLVTGTGLASGRSGRRAVFEPRAE